MKLPLSAALIDREAVPRRRQVVVDKTLAASFAARSPAERKALHRLLQR